MDKENSYKSKKILFSVIVPIFNVGQYLRQCVESLIRQKYKNIEIILVDDGSKDDSSLICDEYEKKDNRIKVIHKDNGGIVSARQCGVELAMGDYIACVDGDDWVSDDYFLRFQEIIKKYTPDVVCCSYYNAYPNFNKITQFNYRAGYYSRQEMEEEIFPKLICDENLNSFSSNLWAKVFKKKIYQQQQLISRNVSLGEDDACVKPTIYHSASMYIINTPLYFYRQNYNSVSKSRKPFSWDGPQIRAEHLIKQMNLNNFDLKNQLYRSVCLSVFTVAVSQFNRNESEEKIRYDIIKNLNRPLYKESIKKCFFKRSLKGLFRLYVLKYRLLYIMKLWNRLR